MRDFQKTSGIKQRRGQGNGFYFSLSSSRFGETKIKSFRRNENESKREEKERKKIENVAHLFCGEIFVRILRFEK